MEVTLAGMHGKVHEGLMAAATYIHCNTGAALQKAAADFPGWPLLVTGHSMGGVLEGTPVLTPACINLLGQMLPLQENLYSTSAFLRPSTRQFKSLFPSAHYNSQRLVASRLSLTSRSPSSNLVEFCASPSHPNITRNSSTWLHDDVSVQGSGLAKSLSLAVIDQAVSVPL